MRYVILPRATWDEERPMIEGKTVHEREPINTGIIDTRGNSIFRVMSPIGFTELKERG